MSQIPLIDDGHVARLERDREHQVDRTPGPVAYQGVSWAANWFCASEGRNMKTIVDTGTGAGVFGQQERRILGPEAVLIGIEVRPEEHAAARHYDRFIVGDATDPAIVESIGGVDATIANPKFKIWPALLRAYLPISRFVMFYGTISWGCAEGDEDDSGTGLTGAALFDEFPPLACGRIRGRVAHRGPGLNPKTDKPWGADQRDCCWWLWKRGNTHPVWQTENLPQLAQHERRWLVPPGSEP